MFIYYEDQSIAEEVEYLLNYLRIPVEMECSCTRDHGLDQCLDIGSSCRNGVYLTIADEYGAIMNMLTVQVKAKQYKRVNLK